MFAGRGTAAIPILVSLFLLLMFNLATAQKWGDVTDEEWAATPPQEFPDSPAMVLFDHGDINLSISEIVFERHVRIKVFSKDRAEDVTSVDITYYDDDDFKDFKAQTILPNGKKHDIDDEFEKKLGSTKTLTFAFSAVEDGAILEYKYKIVHNRYSFMDPWYFQSDVFTRKSRFSVVMYPGFSYNVLRSNMPARKRRPTEEELTDFGTILSKFTWELEDLPPAKEEPLMATAASYLISLRFQLQTYKDPYTNYTFIKSWGDLGSLYTHELEKFASAEGEIASIASRICADMTNIDQKLKALYDFVRDSIETRNDDNEGFIESDGARKLLTQRYGRESNKNLLLVTLARSQGISAYPMLIGTRGYSSWNPGFHHLSQFNHLICFIGEGDSGFALDTEMLSVPFPHTPPYDLVPGGLILDGENSRTVELIHPERSSGMDNFTKVHINSDNSAVCSMYVCLRGHELSLYDEYLLDSISHGKIAEKLTEPLETEHDITSASAFFDVEGDSLAIHIVAEIAEFSRSLGNRHLISPCVLSLARNPFEDDYRFFGIDFAYSFTRKQTTVINLPDGTSAAEMIPDADYRIVDGYYTRFALTSGATVNVMEELCLKRAIFAPGEYGDLKAMFDLMAASAENEIMLTASEM